MPVLRRAVQVVSTSIVLVIGSGPIFGCGEPPSRGAAAPRVRVDSVRPLPALLIARELAPDEIANLARAFGVVEYWTAPRLQIKDIATSRLLVLGTGASVDGREAQLGRCLPAGANVSRGVLYNAGPDPVQLTFDEGQTSIELPVSGLVVVGEALYGDRRAVGNETDAAGNQCSVECGSGYSACCFYDDTGFPRCRCVRDGDTNLLAACHAGGAGAVTCSLNQVPNVTGGEP